MVIQKLSLIQMSFYGNFEGIYGVKTGFTNGANRCLVTACKRGDLDIICVVLGCDTKKDRTKDSVNLLNYTLNNYSIANIKNIVTNIFNSWYFSHNNCFEINKGISQNLNLYLDDNDFSFSNIAVKNSSLNNISTEISFASYFEAPIAYNTKIGEIIVKIDNQKILSIDILNENTIYKKNYTNYLYFIFKNYYKFF